jgi:hypothetical protein
MESHSCIENRGAPAGARESHGDQELSRVNKVGVLGALPMPNPAIGPLPEIENIDNDDSLRCRHIDALGRRCRMFVAAPEITSGDPSDSPYAPAAELCPHHAQRILRRQRANEATAAELLASVSDFTDPPSVNRFLGNLIKLVAVKRIPRKNAVALAYISQLILNSQAAQDRRELMRLRIAELDAQRQENLPTRVIWDLPVRRKPPQEQEAQEANAGKAEPSEAPQPSPVPAAPAASASAQTDNHAPDNPAKQQLATPAPPPPDRPELSSRPPAPPLGATLPGPPTTPASGAEVPAAAPGPPKPIPGFTLTREGHTTDWYAPVSWAKPARKRYPSSRW